MRYANSKHSHKGIGVEPQAATVWEKDSVLITDHSGVNKIYVRDRGQLEGLVKLLRDASILSGWGSIK